MSYETPDETDCIVEFQANPCGVEAVDEPIDATLSTGWIGVYRALHCPLPYAGGENR